MLSFPARCADDVPAYRGALLEQLHRPTFCFATLRGQPANRSPSHPVHTAFLRITGRWLTNSTLTVISVSSQTPALVSSTDERTTGEEGGGRWRPRRGSGSRLCCICFCLSRQYNYFSIAPINPFRPVPSHSAADNLRYTVKSFSQSGFVGDTKKNFYTAPEPSLGGIACTERNLEGGVI